MGASSVWVVSRSAIQERWVWESYNDGRNLIVSTDPEGLARLTLRVTPDVCDSELAALERLRVKQFARAGAAAEEADRTNAELFATIDRIAVLKASKGVAA